MKRTIDEKFAYNEKRNDEFGQGYCFGVTVYRDYAKMNKDGKAAVKQLINSSKDLARFPDMQRAKGFMCGIRDAANERKAHQKR